LIDFGVILCVYLIVSFTVNLEFGYTGVPNFGKVLFVAVGGLTAGSLSYYLMGYLLRIPNLSNLDFQFVNTPEMSKALATQPLLALGLFMFMLVVGALVGAVFGFLASYPAIRLREDYLGMLLLAAGEFLRVFVQSYYPITGGTQGLDLPDVLASTYTTQELRQVVVLCILIVFTVGIFFYMERVARSPLGRTLRAVRDNEIASNALGKNNVAIRRNVLIVGSAISGIAGVLYIIYSPYISPTTFLRTEFTFYPFVIVILGGAANNYGIVAGGFALVGITDVIDQYRTYALLHSISVPIDLNAVEPIAIGVLLIVVLLVRPRGLVSEKPTLTLKKTDLMKLMESTTKLAENKKIPKKTEEKEER